MKTLNLFRLPLVVAAMLAVGYDMAQDKPLDKVPKQAASGERLYKQYCAACHGSDGRGMGPAASALRTPPANLTTLAKRHGGKFPYDYVESVLRFGLPIVAHGSSDMPTWGPIFGTHEGNNEVVVKQRIKGLCDYLATLQEKES
jgi:mono/diheme cytochrome c family protein